MKRALSLGRIFSVLAGFMFLIPPLNLQGGDKYHQVLKPRLWQFPLDHGRHDGYKTEWWYFTGNVKSDDGRRFGYQITFFRSQLVPPAKVKTMGLNDFAAPEDRKQSSWRTSQFYMGHMHIADLDGEKYMHDHISSRGRPGLAHSDVGGLNLQLLNWHVVTLQEKPLTLEVFGKSSDPKYPFEIDLTLVLKKQPTLQGKGGLSQKGETVGQASYYYSMTRLETQGRFTIGLDRYAKVHEVKGMSWMDHEFSSQHLAEHQAGWDWFSIHLNDGTDWMVYRLRDKAGKTDHAFASFIPMTGEASYFKTEDLTFLGSQRWRSPHTKASYPQKWLVQIKMPSGELTKLSVETAMRDQEMVDPSSDPESAIHYYEGSIEVLQTSETKKESKGVGYIEMTGYARPLGGTF